jgi:hypothetical protein
MEAKKMANMSSSGIDTIVQCLGKAVEAARGLESTQCQNLRFVLGIASTEAGRVAKSMRKSSTAQKTASSARIARTPAKAAAKTPARTPAKTTRGTAISAKQQTQQQQQSKLRRTSRPLNGALAH